jgi:BA14K-like protein
MKKQMAALLCGTAILLAVPAAQASVPTPRPERPLAASSYVELLEPVPNAVQALKADNATAAAAPAARVQLAQYHHHHHHHHHHGGGFFPGFAIGAAIGGLMAAAPPPPPPRYYDGRSVEWCLHHYRSYDPNSGTYLGYDGYRHPCP